MRTSWIAAAVTGLVAAGCATAGTGYDTWDYDADGYVMEAEYNEALAAEGVWERWDLDNDGFLDDDEIRTANMNTGFVTAWDRNGDGILDRYELRVGADLGPWAAFDTNRNQVIESDEFYPGLRAAWDVNEDGMLSESELMAGVYATADANKDDRLTEQEWAYINGYWIPHR